MNDMCTTFSLRIEFAWNMSCFRALTTRFAAFNSLFPEMLIDDDVIAVMNTVSPPLRMANTVNIYLPIEGRQILLLSIPSIDIQRFSLYPVKWLRFVTFTICGVHGHLSVTPSGPPVNYNNISLDSIDENYYYNPDGDYNFIDHKAMDGRVISSMHTPHSSSFCDAIMERDGRVCVFTRNTETEAAHLLPKRKGDEYIQVVLQDRLHLYGPTVERSDLGINSVENGILLSMNLHSSFAHGECAFLKTPNFALDPADIPRVETGPIPSSRITLHLWIPDESLNPISQRDAQIAGTGIFPPSTVILDFIYGVTAYQCWGCGNDIKKVMQECFSNHYGSIPLAPPSPQQRERNRNLDVSDEMSRAMDDVLMLSMLLKGRTPESMAAERQRREEAAELCAKEASRAKVEQWMQSCSSHTGSGSKFQSNAASSDHENDLAI